MGMERRERETPWSLQKKSLSSFRMKYRRRQDQSHAPNIWKETQIQFAPAPCLQKTKQHTSFVEVSLKLRIRKVVSLLIRHFLNSQMETKKKVKREGAHDNKSNPAELLIFVLSLCLSLSPVSYLSRASLSLSLRPFIHPEAGLLIQSGPPTICSVCLYLCAALPQRHFSVSVSFASVFSISFSVAVFVSLSVFGRCLFIYLSLAWQ